MVSLTVCTLIGMVGGCLLALPLAFILKMVVIGMGEEPGQDFRSTGVSAEEYRAIRRSVSRKTVPDPLATAPFTVLGPAVICNACRMACSKKNGEVPPECPHCGHHFVDKVVPIARVAAEQGRPRRNADGSDLIELKQTY